MSPVAIGLDLLLVGLLLTALFVGLRLNRRLKALREGQAGFIRAVADLDAAAARAESGLKALRAASEDAHDVLLTRIETARGLIMRLEVASYAASKALETGAPPTAAPAAAPPPVRPAAPALPRSEGRLDPRFRSDALAAAPAPRTLARGVDDDLFESEPLMPVDALKRRFGVR